MLVNKRTVCLKFCLNEIIFFCVSENSLLRDVSMLMSVGLKLIFYEKNLFNENNGGNNCIHNLKLILLIMIMMIIIMIIIVILKTMHKKGNILDTSTVISD